MWREITRRERSHVRRLETRLWKRRRLVALGYAILAMGFVMLMTAACREQESSYVSSQELVLEALYMIGSGGQSGEDSPVQQMRRAREERLDRTYRNLYIIEGLSAAAAYAGYYYYACWRRKQYLSAPLMTQEVVCAGTKEVRRRSWHNFYVNVRTGEGEKLRELWVPWSLREEIESEKPLLLVREAEGEEPRVYPLRFSRGS